MYSILRSNGKFVSIIFVPSGKLTWLGWKMGLLKMYFLLNVGIFHCHVNLSGVSSEGYTLLTGLTAYLYGL